jgi:restriction endonuclease S subunit
MARSGRAAGARRGDVPVRLVSGLNIRDDRLFVNDLEEINVDHTVLTRKHLLEPYDVVLSGKSTALKAAYVPPGIGRAVANSTMVVLQPLDADIGLYLWWLITSRRGRELFESVIERGATLWSLPPQAVAGLKIPVPPAAELRLLARLIEESERAYWASRDAADLRRTALRDHITSRLLNGTSSGPGEGPHAAD